MSLGGSRSLIANVMRQLIRALGAASKGRMRSIPDLPTFAEQRFAGYDHLGSIEVWGPRAGFRRTRCSATPAR